MSNLVFLFIFVPILALILLALNVLLAPHKPDEAKLSVYESGFQSLPFQTREVFNIQFFVICLLFLIFDLEILLLFPIAVTLYQVSTFGFIVVLVFFGILTVGFMLEIGIGAINLSDTSLYTGKFENVKS